MPTLRSSAGAVGRPPGRLAVLGSALGGSLKVENMCPSSMPKAERARGRGVWHTPLAAEAGVAPPGGHLQIAASEAAGLSSSAVTSPPGVTRQRRSQQIQPMRKLLWGWGGGGVGFDALTAGRSGRQAVVVWRAEGETPIQLLTGCNALHNTKILTDHPVAATAALTICIGVTGCIYRFATILRRIADSIVC